MAEQSTGALAVTGVLASVGLGAVFLQLDLATMVCVRLGFLLRRICKG